MLAQMPSCCSGPVSFDVRPHKGETVDLFSSGNTETTRIGYINKNHQMCTGHRGTAGTDHAQVTYRMPCMRVSCSHIYGANGTDVFQRKCPQCQQGAAGLNY